MAKKPDEIEHLFENTFSVDKLEQSIDAKIESRDYRIDYAGSVFVCIYTDGIIKKDTVEKLVQRYIAAGWSALYINKADSYSNNPPVHWYDVTLVARQDNK